MGGWGYTNSSQTTTVHSLGSNLTINQIVAVLSTLTNNNDKVVGSSPLFSANFSNGFLSVTPDFFSVVRIYSVASIIYLIYLRMIVL